MEITLLSLIAQELGLALDDVDLDSSFVGHGGHSLAAVRLSHRCRDVGLAISVVDLLQIPTLRELVSGPKIAPVSQYEFLDLRTSTAPPQKQSHSGSEGDTLGDLAFPATEMQTSLVHGTLANPKMNILCYRQECSGSEIPRLREAWRAVVAAEPILQADFKLHDGRGYWVPCSQQRFPWRDMIVETGKALEDEILKGPNFSDVSFEFKAILKLSDDGADGVRSCILMHIHHAFIDGHSMDLLLTKIKRMMSTTPPTHASGTLDTFRQHEAFARQYRQLAAQFWSHRKKQLEEASTGLKIPPPSPSTDEAIYWNRSHQFDTGVPSTSISTAARSYNVTDATMYYAAWSLVLSSLCDAGKVKFGVVMSGRNLPVMGIMDTVGCFINTLPLVVDIDEGLTTTQFVSRIFRSLAELAAYEWYWPQLQSGDQLTSAVSMQFSHREPTTMNTSSLSSYVRMNSEVSLSLIVDANGRLSIQYPQALFQDTAIRRIGVRMARILAALTNPNYNIRMCLDSSVSIDDTVSLLEMGNAMSMLSTKMSVTESLVSLFTKVSKENPESIAAERNGARMTYQELDIHSSRVASRLSEVINCNDVVGVHADQSFNWLVAIYGVLRAGGVYCPLSPKLTDELRSSTFASSGATVFLVSDAAQRILAPKTCKSCHSVEEFLSNGKECGFPEKLASRTISATDNAYLCFTSGSTGKPKGVLCTHQGLVAFQRDLEVRLFAAPGKRIAQTMSVSFDGSIHELFSALSYGATLVLPDDKDPFAHLSSVDVALLTPSVAKVLDPSEYPDLEAVYLVGEQIPQQTSDTWSEQKALYNMYGPTEATCGSTIKRLHHNQAVTIGGPNTSTRLYILDQKKRLSAPGLYGQIALAGVQVSNGYIGRPDATKEKFVPDTIRPGLDEMMYLTGDIGYWNENAEVVLLGRDDRQIKLNGFRVDLDDLEIRIAGLPDVQRAAVVQNKDHLVAMVQPSSLSVTNLKTLLTTAVPVHAAPRHIFAVDQFPLTRAGKLDYTKIREWKVRESKVLSSPIQDLAAKIVPIWHELLGPDALNSVEMDSDFLALGGTSLLQLRLADRLSRLLSCKLPLRHVIQSRTLHDMVMLCIQYPKTTAASNNDGGKGFTECDGDISPIEHWWVLRYRQASCSSSFNVSVAYNINEAVDRRRLVNSWNYVLAKYTILRSRYIQPEGFCVCRELACNPPTAQELFDLDFKAEVNREFDLSKGNLIRVLVTPHAMLIVASHIICDLTTMQILLSDVASDYHGRNDALTPHPYPARALKERRFTECESAFWVNYLRKPRQTETQKHLLALHGHVQTHAGRSCAKILPQHAAQAIQTLTKYHRYKHQHIGLAAVALALQVDQNHIDITLGTPYTARASDADLGTAGLFLEPLPIRIAAENDRDAKSTASFLKNVGISTRDAQAHAVAWHQLQQICAAGIEASTLPIFEVMVTFHEATDTPHFDVDGSLPLYMWSDGAKFPLMCEFLAVAPEKVFLRLEYDDEILSQFNIAKIFDNIVHAIELLAQEDNFECLRDKLKDKSDHAPSTGIKSPVDREKDYFMAPLAK